jgi:3-oxoacyl-[acyl-carrier-protein] synthase-3
VLFATVTPDFRLPFNAALLQRDLELPNASGFDISSGCAGFVQASQAASTFIQSGAAKTALVVGSEIMSTIIDPDDRGTAVIFGDGAGAVIFQRADEGSKSELLAISGGLQGDDENLFIPDGGSRCPIRQESIDERRTYVRMNGRNIFRFAVDRFTTQIESCCKTAGVDPRDIRLVIPHQVNQRIIESAVRRLEVPMERVVINLDRLGNTASATIPIALDEAIRDGRIERDELLIMVSFGAGLAWAAALYRY